MYKPAYRCLEIQQRIANSWNYRIKAGNSYADLTGYNAKAQVWNKDRTVLYHELTISWQNRIIANPSVQWHFSVSMTDAATLTNDQQAMWDLMLIQSGGQEIYIERGPVFYDPGYTDS